ncbi:MAG TPA: hypothetical protein VIL37_14455 [Natronosporangium sp.]
MLVSRSTEESHLYMYLHPCRCGEAEFEWQDHEIVTGNGWLVAIYSGECGRCGRPRSFEFALAPEPSPPPPALGGDQPSRIIDPGEFLATAEELAADVPADPAEVDDDEFHAARDAVAFAVACVDEVLKFIPAEAELVPTEAIRRAASRRRYRRAPEQFSRRWLTERRDEYRRLLAAYDAAGVTGVPG